MTAHEILQSLIDTLYSLLNFNLTHDQEENFDFLQQKLHDGELAEDTLFKIQLLLFEKFNI